MTSSEKKFYTYYISFGQNNLLSCFPSCTLCFSQLAGIHRYLERNFVMSTTRIFYSTYYITLPEKLV